MKKSLFGLVFMVLTSCSYLTEFYIFNTTTEPITIIYTIKHPSDGDPFTNTPMLGVFNRKYKVKDKVRSFEYTYDPETLTLRCILKPGEALWIGADTNFSLQSEWDAKILEENIEQLTIKTSEGTTTYSQNQILPLFQEFHLTIVGIKVE